MGEAVARLSVCLKAEKHGRMQVLGTVKNALVVWMGILFLADVVTPLQACPACNIPHTVISGSL